MASLRKQRVVDAIDAYLDEERGDIPPVVESQLSIVHDSLKRSPNDSLSPGQLEVQSMTNNQPLDRYPSPFTDELSPGQLEAQQAAQNQGD
jgi:hypothetical protein